MHRMAFYFAVCVLLVAPNASGQDVFVPGGLDSFEPGLERIVPDTVVYGTAGRDALGNWEPTASVVGNSVFLIEANTYAEDPDNPFLSMQRYVLALQPAAGGAPTVGEVFFDDDGAPYRGPINNYRQNGNPGRVAGYARPGAVHFMAGGEASPNEYSPFQSDDRWDTGVVRAGRFAAVQTYSLDPETLVQTPLSKAFDAINGRLTVGDPQTNQINRLGGDLAALDDGNFLVVVEDRSKLHDFADPAVVAAIFRPDGSVVRDSFLIAPGPIWSNVAAFKGGFCVRVSGMLMFFDNVGEFLGQTDQADPGLVDAFGMPVLFDRGRGDGVRIAGHINSPYIYLAGRNGSDVHLAVWDARDGTYLAQINVNELTEAEGGRDEATFRPTMDRVNLAVDALNRVAVVYDGTLAGVAEHQTFVRVLRFDAEEGEFDYLTPTFFPFVNTSDGAPTINDGIRTMRPSLAMTTRQICVAARGEINSANEPWQGADTPLETNFYTVFSHPEPMADPTPPITLDVTFRRGDVNADGKLDIADAIFLLGHLFAGGAVPVCQDSADANDDGKLDIADAITILGHLFGGAPSLPPPFEDCGVDPTDDDLDCLSFPPCE